MEKFKSFPWSSTFSGQNSFKGSGIYSQGGGFALHCKFHLNKKSWSNLSRIPPKQFPPLTMFMYVFAPNDKIKMSPLRRVRKNPFSSQLLMAFHWAKFGVEMINSQLVAPSRILPNQYGTKGGEPPISLISWNHPSKFEEIPRLNLQHVQTD